MSFSARTAATAHVHVLYSGTANYLQCAEWFKSFNRMVLSTFPVTLDTIHLSLPWTALLPSFGVPTLYTDTTSATRLDLLTAQDFNWHCC